MSDRQDRVGLVGLGVMGSALTDNLIDQGHTVIIHDIDESSVQQFVAPRPDAEAVDSLDALCQRLPSPRQILLLVPAGDVVDEVLDSLMQHLTPGDVVVDLGNSHWPDTERRAQQLQSTGVHFIGSGISGGENGARYGASIMPGGDERGWLTVAPTLQSVAAKVDGEPCCGWIGAGASGHYVKMVHNGIEYGDMQLICETYDILHRGLGLNHDAMSELFSSWNEGPLESYLIEITADILKKRDDDGQPLVEKVLDRAGQKGTGKWTGIAALELGIPLTLIAEAVFARCTSAMLDERQLASQRFGSDVTLTTATGADNFIDDLQHSLFAAKLVSYAQGFMLMQAASIEHGWQLNASRIARLWRGGCIIRSRFLNDIAVAFDEQPDLPNLMLNEHFARLIESAIPAWRRVVSAGVQGGFAMPALTSALTFFDAYRSARLPANLLQAQRDCFGAHTYERVDAPRGKKHHSEWRS